MTRVHDSVGGDNRRAIVVALEALEAGDQRYAVDVLLGALDDGSAERRCICAGCGAGFEWQGMLDHHLDVSGCGAAAEEESAVAV